jgi:glycerol-3-phosphate cytidylyltransferase
MIRRLKLKGYRVGTANGCFDLMHPGHVAYLRKCRELLGKKAILVVLVNDDRWCAANKGHDRPVIPQQDRLEMVRGIKGVTFAYLFQERTPEKWLRRIRPDVHFKGVDWKDKDCPEARYAKEMRFVPFEKHYSTTALVSQICERYGPNDASA